MSVLNKYNQRVIAILGTITIVALSLTIIITAISLTAEFIDSMSYESYESGLTMETEQKGDSILRDQAVSLELPLRIDSAKQLYIIPVGQANLEYSKYVLGTLNTLMAAPAFDDFHDLNNLIVYNANSNESWPLFDQKTSISQFKVIESNDNQFIIISAGQKDTDRNGRLNDGDLFSLYIYDVTNKMLHPFEQPGRGLTRAERLYSTSNIIAQYGIDENRNGRLESSTEPHTQMIISLEDLSAKDMVSEATLNRLQKIID